MPRDSSFWRNVGIIAAAHVVVLTGVLRWSAGKSLSSNIVWLEGGGAIAANFSQPSSPSEAEPEPSPSVVPEPTVQPMEDPLTMRTPPPEEEPETPSPSPKPSPDATPKATSKPTPLSTPKKNPTAKSSPKPTQSKKEVAPNAKKTSVKAESGNKGPANPTAAAGAGSRSEGAGSASQYARYGSMLHDRFFGAWDQPTSVVATGAKMSVLVRIRIEKDGSVSDFSLVRPSGNVVVDESVAAVARRMTRVDPLPPGLGNGGHYDVNINFELNAE